MKQIMDMVDPSEVVQNSISYQFRAVLNDRIEYEKLDTETIAELGSTFTKLQGEQFYDPDVKNDVLYTKKDLRNTNKH